MTTTPDPIYALHDFHEALEPFVPEDRHRPIGQWPMTVDDVIGLSGLLADHGLQVTTIPDANTRQEVDEVDEDALNEGLDSLEDWESALRSTIRNQVTAGFNVTAQGDLADLLVRAHRWIAAAYLGRND